MANITRIKNNQITDSTITYTKLAAGTLVGSVFNANLTLNSNVTILGNLTIAGTPTTIQSTNTYVNDPLVVFNNGYTGSPSYDIGIIANRNLQSLASYGSVNVAWIWEESAGQWQAIATTETGSTTGTINNSGWANVRVGNLISVTSNTTGAAVIGGTLGVTGATILSSTLNVTGSTTLTTATAGGLQAVAIGNVTPGTGAFTTLTTSGAFVSAGNLVVSSTTDTSDLTTGALMVAGGASIAKKVMVGSGANTTRFPNSQVVISTTAGGIQQNESLYVGLMSEATSVNTTWASGIYGVGYTNSTGNGRGTGLTGEAHVSASADTGSAVGVRGYSNDTHSGGFNIGLYGTATGSSTGNYALYMESGDLRSVNVQTWTLVDNQASALSLDAAGKTGILLVKTTDGAEGVTMSGTLGVTGATTLSSTLGVTGVATFGSNVVANSGTASTNTTTGALIVNGGVGVSGAIYAGSVYDNSNRVITGLTSSGTGNLTVGGTAPSLTVALPSTGPGASTWGGATQIPSITFDAYGRASTAGNTALNTVAVTNLGNTTEITSNASVGLVGLSLTTTGVTAGNYGSATTIPTIVVDNKGRVTSITTNALSTSFSIAGTSGTGTVAAGSTLTFAGTYGVTVSVGQEYANISTPQDLRVTSNPTFNNIAGASFQGVIGNVTPAAGTFTTGTFSSATVNGTLVATTVNAATIGNTGASLTGTIQTADQPNITSVGTLIGLTVSGSSTFNNITGASFQGVIGNVTPAAGTFTTGTFNTATTGGLQAVAIGNVTPGTGAFTTLSASGAFAITDATESTSTTTGALKVSGGVGIAKNLNVGGNVVVTGNLTVQGTMTAIQSQTLDVTDLNITVAKGAASSAAANGAGITVDTAGATLLYASADDSWNVNKLFKGTSATFNTVTTGGLQAVAIGNVTPGTAQFTTLGASGASTLNTITGASLQAVAIGNVTPGTGAFTSVTAQTETIGGLQAVAIGNVTPGTAAFTTTTVGGLQAVAIGNVTPGTAVFTSVTAQTETVGGLQAVAIGNVTPGTAQFTTLGASGTTTLGLTSAAAINNTPIGNATPSTGAFTTSTVGGLQAVAIGNVTPGTAAFTTTTVGGLQAVAIGNATPGTGAFTTLSATGTSTLNTVTGASFQGVIGNVTPAAGYHTTLSATGASTLNTVTGASFQGVIGNVTPALGTFTTLTATTLSIPAINGTVIGNVTPAAGYFTTLGATGVVSATNATASTSNTTGAVVITGGLGVGGNINTGGPTSYNIIGGNLLIGNPGHGFSSTATTFEINQNADSTPLTSTGIVHISAKDGNTGKITIDSFGTGITSVYEARTSRGTSMSPSAVQFGDVIGGMALRGHGATGHLNNTLPTSAGFYTVAADNFTDTAQGQLMFINTVKVGSNTATTAMRLGAEGNIVIPAVTPSTSTTTGALVTAGGVGIAKQLFVGGNASVTGNATVSGALTVTDSITGSSGIQVAGNISTLSTTDTTAPGVGSIRTPGGVSIGGNAYIGSSIFIGTASFTTPLTTPTVIATASGASYTQSAIINQAYSGSSDFLAYPANYAGASDDHGWADLGFTGNAFNDPNYTITKAHDAYVFGSGATGSGGGNLVLATDYTGSYNDIVIASGSFYANSEVARFHGNASTNGTFIVKLPTNAVPAANTGAFQVWGGASISGNSYTGGAAIFNGGQTANYDVVARGKTDTSLLWARPGTSYDQVIIGGSLSASSLTSGAKLTINSTDSMLLPSGTTGQRPGSSGFTDVQGMFRFNTTLGAIEWYTGSVWNTVSTTFTIITDEQFSGDGSTVDFTLGGPTTSAGTIVSINGVVQVPSLAYSITGAGNTTLEFTEAPAAGDLIDVRRLTTTQTLFGVASPNGKMAYQTDNNGVYIYTGITGGTSTATTSWDIYGSTVRNNANVSVASANTATTVLTINNSLYRSGKLVVQATSGTSYQVSEALVISDGTTATIVNYGTIQTAGNLGIITATQSGANVLVQFTAVNSGTTIRVIPDLVTI